MKIICPKCQKEYDVFLTEFLFQCKCGHVINVGNNKWENIYNLS